MTARSRTRQDARTSEELELDLCTMAWARGAARHGTARVVFAEWGRAERYYAS